MYIANSYHHFKGQYLSRADKIERFVVDSIINSPLTDEERESSRAWELMHSSTCKVFMHLLAEKRGLDPEICRIAGALHDYYVIATGKYKNHARLGAPMVEDILKQTGDFTEEEIAIIKEMVACHSEKHIHSGNGWVELTKDADVFDCSLYAGTETYYLAKKPFPICREYFSRMSAVRQELGLPHKNALTTLDRLSNSKLICFSQPLGDDHVIPPLVSHFALLSLLEYLNSKNIKLATIHSINNSVLWQIHGIHYNSNVSCNSAISWDEIRNVADNISSFNTALADSASESDVRKLLIEYKNIIKNSWFGFISLEELKNQLAVTHSEFLCNPKVDSWYNSTIKQLIAENVENDKVIEMLSLHSVIEVKDTELKNEVSNKKSFELLAKLECLKILRSLASIMVTTAINSHQNSSKNSYMYGLLNDIVAGEVHLQNPKSEDWLIVNWPLFGSSEFYRGDEATGRLISLKSYLTNGC